MGNTTDKNINIYLQVDKQYYNEGDMVKGQIYLNVLAPTTYSILGLKFIGAEQTYWTTRNGKHRRHYYQKQKNYETTIVIKQFENNLVNQGQYLFPFEFVLPSLLPGTFSNSQRRYIRYTLSSFLASKKSSMTSQQHKIQLRVLESQRLSLKGFSLLTSQKSSCCYCFISYGTVSIVLNCDKNFVFNGDKIRVSGQINNSLGKEIINQCRLKLKQYLFMCDGNSTNLIPLNNFPLKYINENIGIGKIYQFDFTCQIPANIYDNTAIGSIISHYFILEMQTQYGCCTTTASAKLHLILHSKTPKIENYVRPNPPPQWSPLIYPKVCAYNLPPFIYKPNSKIPYTNMPNSFNANNSIGNHPNFHSTNTDPNAIQPYFSNSQTQPPYFINQKLIQKSDNFDKNQKRQNQI